MASAKGKRISIGNFSPQVVLQRTFHGDDSSGNKPGLHVNDDNAEKLLRKQTKVLELVQKHSPVRCSDRRRSVFQTSNGSLSSAELAEQYANCIKLSAENKITIKNAFALHLIDYMAAMVKKSDSEMNNFQVASCTLDASTKIFACRVDCVHSDTFKMVNGLAHSNQNKHKNDQERGDDGELGQTKKNKKRKDARITIESNLNNLNLNKLDYQLEMDPLFQKTTEMFSDGGVLSSYIFCRDDSHELLLDSASHQGNGEFDPKLALSSQTGLNDFKLVFNDVVDQAIKICPLFADFEFGRLENEDKWDLSLALQHAEMNDKITDSSDGEHELDNPANDIDCDDGNSIPDVNVDVVNEDGQEPDISLRSNALAKTINNIITANPNEYSYFDEELLSAWAGPNHWTIRPRSRDKKPEDGHLTAKLKEKIKKPSFRILYDDDDNWDFQQFFQRPKQTVELAKSSIDNWNETDYTLPEDLHYKKMKLLQSFLKVSCIVKQQRNDHLAENDDVLSNYDYNNANDVGNFIPVSQDKDLSTPPVSPLTPNFPDTLFGETVNESFASDADADDPVVNDQELPAYTGENLVQQPFKLAKYDIPYARVAKKINIKRLKTCMWKLLTGVKINESGADKSGNVMTNEEESMTMSSDISFIELCTNLLNALPGPMAKDFSAQIAFVGLLHLANEKNLKLTPHSDLRDFRISQCVDACLS